MSAKTLIAAGIGFLAVWWWLGRKNSTENKSAVVVDIIGRNGSAAVYTSDGELVGYTNTEFISPWTVGYGVRR